jgi:hypothetical protein
LGVIMSQRLLITAVAASGLFHRCGRGFTREGVVVIYPDEFTPEEWERLKAEPMLHITKAPEGAEAEATAADLRALLRAAIGKLEQADFGEDGVPKADVLRKLLPAGTKGVTRSMVAEVWAELKPPAS